MKTESKLRTLWIVGLILACAVGRAFAGKPGGGSTTTIATNPLAAQAGAKLFVSENGWYSVSRQNLIDSGWDPGSSPTYLQLWAEGNQQAILVNAGSDGRFDPSDTIEFLGTTIDTPSTGTRVYWLVQGSSPGVRVKTQAKATGKNGPPSFTFTAKINPKYYYAPDFANGSADGFYGDAIGTTPTVETIAAPDPYPANANDILKITLQGASNWNHSVGVQLNGNPVGTIAFSGEIPQASTFSVPSGWVVDGENAVALVSQNGWNDSSFVVSIELTYPRSCKAYGDLLQLTAGGSQILTVGGFSVPTVRAFDITASSTPQLLLATVSSAAGGYSAKLTTISSTGNRIVLAVASNQILSPEIVANAPAGLAAPLSASDFVIIAHPSMVEAASALADLRRQQGLRVSVVDVTSIYDTFSYGEKDPQAIKNFLQYARTNWTVPPRYVLLLGGACLDPRNYLGYGELDFVPTRYIAAAQLRSASDDWFVDFDNNGSPDMAIGRIPADSPAEASAAVAKIVAYEGVSGAWTKNVLMVADANDAGNNYESASASAAARIPGTISKQNVFSGQIGASAARAAISGGFNSGQLIVNYDGVGLEQGWSNSYFFMTSDVPSLTNSSELPLVVSMGGPTGFFVDPYTDSLASSLLKAPNGGAVAVWASSGTNALSSESAMNQQLYTILFNGTHPTIGDAVAQAKSATADLDARRTFILFGDPTMRLAQ